VVNILEAWKRCQPQRTRVEYFNIGHNYCPEQNERKPFQKSRFLKAHWEIIR
jgi:hypothetical protein